LLKAATALDEVCTDLPLSLDLPGAAEARRAAAAARQQLADYVIPRLRDVDAPALVVVGGSTGAGKSTIVNSLVGDEVSKPGVLRPTTRSPVLVHHPATAMWFEGTRILGGISRIRGGPATRSNQLELVARPSIPDTIAVVDAPDFDSVVDANREIATQLLDAADLWVFVTTAARYADAVPWTFLRSAVSRGMHVAIVLNRVPPGAAAEVGRHLAEMLRTEGLGTAPVFTIDEQLLDGGLLPDRSVQPLRAWLGALASDQQARAAIIRRSLVGTIGELAAQADRLAGAVDYQGEFVQWLADRVDDAFRRAHRSIAEDIRNGTVMRGEVLARWQDLVGTGELLKQLQSAIGRLRDRIGAALSGRPQATERFQGAVSHGIEIVVRERTAQAVDDAVGYWRVQPPGQALLDEVRTEGVDLTRPERGLDERTARLVRDWQASVLELLRRQGAGKRRTAKALSYGVNGLAAVLMVGIFAQTGGLTGAEVVIAGGSSAVGHQVLAAVLGDQAVRSLTETARADLERRIGADVLGVEAQRFLSVLERHRPGDRGARLREVGHQLATALDR
jgi:hypothetical protein